jgi:hypothetical protein
MEEYIIEKGNPSEIQKHLNQWRHDYVLTIHNTHCWPNGELTIIVSRIRKAE